MSRSRTRMSRALIVVLILTIVIGVEEYNRHARQAAASRAAVAANNAPSAPAIAAPASAAAPATRPAGARAAAAPAAPGVQTGNPLLLAGNHAQHTQTPAASPAGAKVDAGEPLSSRAIPAAGVVAATPATSPADSGAVPAAGTIPSSVNPLADGKALIESGKLIEGRAILNDALIAGRLRGGDIAAAKSLIQQANQTIIFSPRRFADDPFGATMTVPPGGVLAKIAISNTTTVGMLCRINNITNPRSLRANATLKLIRGPFYGVVTKSAFTIDLYLGAPGGPGSMYVATFPIGLGKDDSTPTGTWTIEPGHKLKDPTYYSPRGEGIIKADDPKNPLGKYWIGLTGADGQALGKMSYGIHGNADPDSIGKQSSMGCIRMRNDDIPLVFDMLVEGKSKVIVNP